MPKYMNDVIAGYVLYFTSKCVVEAIHVHASDKEMDALKSAKLFVYEDGETKIERWGTVNEQDMRVIRQYIKNNHAEMYKKWSLMSENGYYGVENDSQI